MPLLRGTFDEGRYVAAHNGTVNLLRHGRNSRAFLAGAANEGTAYKEAVFHTMLDPTHLNAPLRRQLLAAAGMDERQEGNNAALQQAHATIVHLLSHPEHQDLTQQVLTHDRTVRALDQTAKRFNVLFGRNRAEVFFRAARGARGFAGWGAITRHPVTDARSEMAQAVLGALREAQQEEPAAQPTFDPHLLLRGGAVTAAAAAGGNASAAAAAGLVNLPMFIPGPHGHGVRFPGGGGAAAAAAAHGGAAVAAAAAGIVTHPDHHMFGVDQPVTHAHAIATLSEFFSGTRRLNVRVFDHVRRGFDKFYETAPREQRRAVGDERLRNSHVTNLLVAADGFVQELMTKGLHDKPHDVEHVASIASQPLSYADFLEEMRTTVKRSTRHQGAEFLNEYEVDMSKLFDKTGKVQLKEEDISAHNVHALYTKDNAGNLTRLTPQQISGLSFYVLGKLSSSGNLIAGQEHIQHFIRIANDRTERADEAWRSLSRTQRVAQYRQVIHHAMHDGMNLVEAIALARAVRGWQPRGGGH